MSYIGTTKIGKMYLGNTEIAKAYLGNTLVFQKGGGSSSIPYIRGGGSGGPYIDTGITVDNTVKVILWARNWGIGAGQMFGSREGATQNTYLIANYLSDSNTGNINLCYAQTNSTYILDQVHNLGGYHKYEYYNGTLKIDDIVVGSAPTGAFSNNVSIHIWGFNNNGTHVSPTYPFDISKVEIWKNDVLVRRMSPVESPSVGFYDSVSDTVFTNAGGGAFTYGTFDLSEYTPLQYIECTSLSYINTGVLATYSLPVVSKFRPGGSTAAYRFLLGARTGSQSGRCEFSVGDSTNLNRAYYFNYVQYGYKVYDSASETGNDLIWFKTNNISRLYKSGTRLGSDATGPTDSSFSTTYPLFIGATNGAGTATAGFLGRIYYVGLGASGTFLPMKKGSVVGLYEMYSDTFYPSESENSFVAGPSAKLTHYFKNKNISIIGDSISTYNATGYKYDSYSMYYPAGDVDNVNKTWWKQLIDGEEGTFVDNLSYSGSCVAHRGGNYPSLYDRASLLGNCDMVIIALGANDTAQSIPLGDYSYNKSVSELSDNYFREAYIKGIKQIKVIRPNAKIMCLAISVGQDYVDSIQTIAEHYNLEFLRIINADYTKQAGVHPDYNGMRVIYRRLLSL